MVRWKIREYPGNEIGTNLDLVDVQMVRWDKGGTVRAGGNILFYGKGNKNHQLKQEFLYTK